MNDSSVGHAWRYRCLPSVVCLAAIWGCAGVLGAGELLLPPAAFAYTNESTVTLQPQMAEPYDAFIRRAELAARASAQRSFDSDILVTDVTVTILGQNGRSIAPLLTLSVNRNQWRNQPDPRRWATYYPSAKLLLGLDSFTGQPAGATSAPLPGAAAGTPGAAPDINTPTINSPTAPNSPAASPPAPPSAAPGETPDASESPSPVRIHLPAVPGGEVGLPRSVLH